MQNFTALYSAGSRHGVRRCAFTSCLCCILVIPHQDQDTANFHASRLCWFKTMCLVFMLCLQAASHIWGDPVIISSFVDKLLAMRTHVHVKRCSSHYPLPCKTARSVAYDIHTKQHRCPYKPYDRSLHDALSTTPRN